MSLGDFKMVSLEQMEATALMRLGGEHHVTQLPLCVALLSSAAILALGQVNASSSYFNILYASVS